MAFLTTVACVLNAGAGFEFHEIEASGAYRVPGKPPTIARFQAIAGKPLEIRWSTAGHTEPPAVKVDRITHTRRIPVSEGNAGRRNDQWSWSWEPPLTQGLATYEVTLAGTPPAVARIDVWHPKRLEDGLKLLKAAQWTTIGLSGEERRALSDLGLKSSAGKSGGAPDPAKMAMEPATGMGGPRREVILDEGDPDRVTWWQGSAEGEWRVSVPRWWLSSKSLATDEGKLRLVDLFLTSPTQP